MNLAEMGEDSPAQGDVDACGEDLGRFGPENALQDARERPCPHSSEESGAQAAPQAYHNNGRVGACRHAPLPWPKRALHE